MAETVKAHHIHVLVGGPLYICASSNLFAYLIFTTIL